MELPFLIFLAFSHQLASALLGQPPEKISPKNEERSKGICDGRVLQHSFSQHSRPEPKNNFPTVGRSHFHYLKGFFSLKISF